MFMIVFWGLPLLQWSLSVPVTEYTAEIDLYSVKPVYRIPLAGHVYGLCTGNLPDIA